MPENPGITRKAGARPGKVLLSHVQSRLTTTSKRPQPRPAAGNDETVAAPMGILSGTVGRSLVEMVGPRARPGQIQSFLRMMTYTTTEGTTTMTAADTRPDCSPAPG